MSSDMIGGLAVKDQTVKTVLTHSLTALILRYFQIQHTGLIRRDQHYTIICGKYFFYEVTMFLQCYVYMGKSITILSVGSV